MDDLVYRNKAAKPGFFSVDTVEVPITRARLCLECGHVMFFAQPNELQALLNSDFEANLEGEP